jgi:hypothetical protein
LSLGPSDLFATAAAAKHAGAAFSTERSGQHRRSFPAGRDHSYLLIFQRLLPLHRAAFYLGLLFPLEPPMSEFPHELNGLEPQQSMTDWLIAFVGTLVVLTVLTVLPRLWG